MNLSEILQDKTLKAKAKTEKISSLLLNEELKPEALWSYADSVKDSDKATCIEAFEYATKSRPQLATLSCLKYVATCLKSEAPRVKWESAKAVANIAHLFPEKLKPAVQALLANTENEGTVVRWAAALALGEIIKLKTNLNKELIPFAEALSVKEEDNAIRKKYADALKKASKLK